MAKKRISPGTIEIVAIQPAGPEWAGMYHDYEGNCVALPVACWAIIKEYKHVARKKGQRVVAEGEWVFRTAGMVSLRSQLVPADEIPTFLGYDHPMLETDYVRKAEEQAMPKGPGGMINLKGVATGPHAGYSTGDEKICWA